jgi:hypothetical protein
VALDLGNPYTVPRQGFLLPNVLHEFGDLESLFLQPLEPAVDPVLAVQVEGEEGDVAPRQVVNPQQLEIVVLVRAQPQFLEIVLAGGGGPSIRPCRPLFRKKTRTRTVQWSR